MDKYSLIKCATNALDTATDIELSKPEMDLRKFGKSCKVDQRTLERIKDEIKEGNLNQAKNLVMEFSLKKIELG